MRRRLEESGTSYRGLVDEVRRDRALAQLAPNTDVSTLAQGLGFSDATALARAFRRWTGRSPQEYLRDRATAELAVRVTAFVRTGRARHAKNS